ncbi:CHAT domain-containing protein [Rathayibacter sp. VKM Ac-2928]|uniref:CHAT domain-containing protein n=1 Tax=Rathayibacter sp. VKM Ac-2928 TaxID=2929479 RepID=UPI001FB346D0|nr:CHAT domain-containing protein [Rathayibacter sp. VKM Ac-2928]MCJ1685346.1 CHAT domain-containing protein [Rathayibacter sp. VKM Ac-2928]
MAALVRRLAGALPLKLDWGVADVPHTCPSCKASFVVLSTIVADWLDHVGAQAQVASAEGIECPACGRKLPFAAPLFQIRNGDAADLLAAFPWATTPDEDTEWVVAARAAFPEMTAARIAPVRVDWWRGVSAAPLGPVLVGVIDPDVPAPHDEIRSWRSSVTEMLPMPPITAMVGQLAVTETYAAAQALLEAHPELVAPQWRTTVRATIHALINAQPDPQTRDLVMARTIQRLRTLDLFRGGAPTDLQAEVQMLVDAAAALAPSDGGRLEAVRTATAALESTLREGVEVAGALTSLSRALYDSPRRNRSYIEEAIRVADRAVAMAESAFDADHDLVVMNRANSFVMAADLLGPDPADVESAVDRVSEYARILHLRASPHLPDVLTNLVGLMHRQRNLPRAARSEAQLGLLAQAERAALLLDPDNTHLRFVIETNIATTYGARIVGTSNADTALESLSRTPNQPGLSLSAADLLMRRTTEVSITYRSVRDSGSSTGIPALLERCVGLRDAALALSADSEVAITALVNSASIMGDLVHRSDPAGAGRQYLPQALVTARLAVDRAAEHLGLTTSAHLTALITLGNLQSLSDSETSAADSAASYRSVVELARGNSDHHVAVAWRNLGTLYFEVGSWAEAATSLEQAGYARRRLVDSADGTHLILGELADSEDLVGREALARVLEGRPLLAVAAVERSRGHLLRRRLGLPPTDLTTQELPESTTIHLTGSNIGTSLVIRGTDGVRFATAYALGVEVADLVAQLLRVRSRAARSSALRQLGAKLSPVLADIVSFARGDTDLHVVTSGAWAGVPLHILLREQGPPKWRPTVRYLPSEGIGLALRERPTRSGGDAIAFIDPDGDLPLAAHEGAAFTSAYPDTRTFPGATTRTTALASIADAHTIHLACHARFDSSDPTRSHLSLGQGQELTFADLIATAEAQHLDLVVASACQSGASGGWNPDEMTAIAHGFLHVGARAVVTTLWDVNDLPAALVMCKFYSSDSVRSDPATALSEAQDWLRALNPADAANGFHELPLQMAEILEKYLKRLEPDDAPFANAIDWGAFVYVGP